MGHSSTTGYWIPKKALPVSTPAVRPKAPKTGRRRGGSGSGFGRSRPSGAARPKAPKPPSEEALDIDAEEATKEVEVRTLPRLTN